MQSSAATTIGALALCALGVGLLRWAWGSNGKRRWAIPLGWACPLLAIWLGQHQLGWEYATAFALMGTPLSAWAWVLANVEIRPEKPVRAQQEPDAQHRNLHSTSSLAKQLKKWSEPSICWLLAGPLGGIAALLIAIVFTQWLPFSTASQMVLAAFLFPLLWAGLAIWLSVSDRRWVKSLSLFTLALSSGLYLFQ